MKKNSMFFRRKHFSIKENISLLIGSIYESYKYAFIKHFINLYNG